MKQHSEPHVPVILESTGKAFIILWQVTLAVLELKQFDFDLEVYRLEVA